MLMPALFGENLFDDFWDDFSGFPFYDNSKEAKRMERQLYGHKADKLMKTDIKETDSNYVLAVDLPGFKKEDIKASIEDGYLTIIAQKTVDKEQARYLRKERFSGSLQRAFYVGENITQEDVRAQFKHGVLRLIIPKKEQNQTKENKYIAIEG